MASESEMGSVSPNLPRIAIQCRLSWLQTIKVRIGFLVKPLIMVDCTQCHWMLRAAYFAQELLSTFSTSLGEVALIPSKGGTFTIEITVFSANPQLKEASKKMLWDRASNGGFPDVKHLKRMIRDLIEPDRELGHIDRHSSIATSQSSKNDRYEASDTQVPGKSVPQSVSDSKMDESHDRHQISKPDCNDCDESTDRR